MIKVVIPGNFKSLSENQAAAQKIINKHKEGGYLTLIKEKQVGSINNNNAHYLMKKFAERYSAILHLIQHPKEISKYSGEMDKLVKSSNYSESQTDTSFSSAGGSTLTGFSEMTKASNEPTNAQDKIGPQDDKFKTVK